MANRQEDNLNGPRVPDAINLKQEWRLGNQLGAGGFANVYRAQSRNGTPAVVKLVRKLPGTHRELLFTELDDVPNVVPVIDWGELDDYWVLVMPEAEKSLRDHLLEANGRLDTSDAVLILVDVTHALVAMESRVVHRDIKPDNILLLDGNWCLADFGIARYAEATTAPDTLKYSMSRAYAAPEQWRGERASSATDVYALGVVAYELLAGRLPFQGVDQRQQHLEENPETLSGISDRLRSLVNECLYKGHEARPRPQNLLTRLQASMQASSTAAARLQQANALAVQRKTEDERQQSAAQVEAERRRALRAAAEQSLETTLLLLHQQIADNAPAVLVTGSPPKSWALNNATLRVDQITVAVPKPNEHVQLPFDVVAQTSISLSIPRDRYGYAGRAHSLWFCDAQQAGVFRWHETAFMITFAGHERRGFTPFNMSPGDPDALLALSPVLHTHQVAWPFTPIDQGDEDAFIERWIGWLGEAAQGQMRRPSTLPEISPQGSWRR